MQQIDINLCDIPTQKISSNSSSNMLVHGNGSVHALKGKFIVKLKNCNSSSTLALHRFTWLWLFHASMQQHVPSSKDNRYRPVLRPLRLHLKIPHFFPPKKTDVPTWSGPGMFFAVGKTRRTSWPVTRILRQPNPPRTDVGDVALVRAPPGDRTVGPLGLKFYVLKNTQRNHVTNAGWFSGGVQRSIWVSDKIRYDQSSTERVVGLPSLQNR